MKFMNNDLLNCNNKLIINYKRYIIIHDNLKKYTNEAKRPQARRFWNCFENILDQSRCMGQIDPVCFPRFENFQNHMKFFNFFYNLRLRCIFKKLKRWEMMRDEMEKKIKKMKREERRQSLEALNPAGLTPRGGLTHVRTFTRGSRARPDSTDEDHGLSNHEKPTSAPTNNYPYYPIL